MRRTFEVPLRLVVIDTLAKATAGADEISGKDMSIVLDNVDTIQTKTGAHVMLVHHMNAGGAKVRGHTSIYANVDQVLLVNRDEETKIRTVVLDKQKDDEEGARFQFELPQVVVGIDDEGRQITSCVCKTVGEREVVRREEELKGLRLAPLNENFMRAFFEADKRYGFPVPTRMTMPAQVRNAGLLGRHEGDVHQPEPDRHHRGRWAEQLKEAAVKDGKYRDRMRKRIEKARVDLTNIGALGVTTVEEPGGDFLDRQGVARLQADVEARQRSHPISKSRRLTHGEGQAAEEQGDAGRTCWRPRNGRTPMSGATGACRAYWMRRARDAARISTTTTGSI